MTLRSELKYAEPKIPIEKEFPRSCKGSEEERNRSMKGEEKQEKNSTNTTMEKTEKQPKTEKKSTTTRNLKLKSYKSPPPFPQRLKKKEQDKKFS